MVRPTKVDDASVDEHSDSGDVVCDEAIEVDQIGELSDGSWRQRASCVRRVFAHTSVDDRDIDPNTRQ